MIVARQNREGFTATELMIAIVLSLVVVGGIMAAFVQGLLIVQQEQTHSELQMDLELAMAHVQSDLRLSSVGISMMSFYPTNSSRFTAISMPVSRDTNGWAKVDTNGRVIWTDTVIYHVKPGTPDQLMRTVFSPRYTNAADLLYNQLARVVTATSAAQYASARLPFGSPTESVSTNVIFSNLVDVEFTSGDTNMTLDCYSPKQEKIVHTFGSIVIGPGNHVVKFRVDGKNPASTNFNFALDKLTLSPSRSAREGEMFDPNNVHPIAPYYSKSVSGGGTAAAFFQEANQSNPIFSNLKLTNAVINSELSLNIYNDLWCDTMFDTPGAVRSNCSAKLDYGFMSIAPYTPDWVVSPDMGEAWAAAACGDYGVHWVSNDTILVSNFIYGVNEWCNLKINQDGRWARFWFQRADDCELLITNAWVVDHFVSPEIASNITFNGGSGGVFLSSTGDLSVCSDWVPMWDINRTGLYSVVAELAPSPPARGAPTFADIDGDGDLDMFIGNSQGRIRFYRNEGTASAPAFPTLTDGFWQNISVASAQGGCNPGFGDVDNDGDLDLFVGIKGGSVPAGRYFMFYRNEGSSTNALMVAEPASFMQTEPPSGNPGPCRSWSMNATPTLVDLNADGVLDFLHGWMTSTYPRYFTGVTNPSGFAVSGLSGTDFSTGDTGLPPPAGPNGNNSAPALVDIDADGDLDLFLGQGNGFLSFFQNTGASNAHSFAHQSSAYAGLSHDINSMPAFADIDGDGDHDLFTGAQDGKVYFYRNTGTSTNAAWTLESTNYLGTVAWPAASWINPSHFSNGYWLSSADGVDTDRIIGLKSIEVGYATHSVYRSGVFDTLKPSPAYNQLNMTWVENTPAGDVDVRVRSADTPDMAGASWTAARALDDGYFQGNIGNNLASLPNRRYVQYEALFTINGNGTAPTAHTNTRPDAILRDLTIDWPGALALVDLNAAIDMGPDCGIVTATVDDEILVEGVGVKMEIYKVSRTGTNTVRGVLQIRPLNTRR